MTTPNLSHPLPDRRRSDLERPQGMLTVVVLLGGLGLAWFALTVWLALSAVSLP
jgi:hypothetical protein